MGYDGFISYSHAADGRFAPALQRGLQRLARPWNHRRALNVFRDETGLSTNPHLWSAIEAALDDSEWFLLLASPEAAQSDWVNKELSHWLATKSSDRILPVVTDGTWAWNPATREVDGTAVPAALADAFSDEPRHLDLRWARDETDLDLRNSRFRSAVADLAAPMHGIPKDELEGEDIRQHRRARRTARAAGAVLVVLTAVAVAAAFAAFRNADRARAARDESDYRRVVAESGNLKASNRQLALLLAVQARHLRDTPQSRGALQAALTQDSRFLGTITDFTSRGSVASLCPLRDNRFLVGRQDGTIRFVNLESGRHLGPAIRLTRPDPTLLSATGLRKSELGCAESSNGVALVVFSPSGSVWSVQPNTRQVQPPRRTGAALADVALSPSGDTVALGTSDGRVLIAPVDRPEVAPLALASGSSPVSVSFSPDGLTLASTTPDHITLWDTKTWSVSGSIEDPPSDFESGGLVELSEPGRTIRYSPDGGSLADARRAETRVFDIASGSMRWNLRISDTTGHPLVFTPDGTTVYTVSPSEELLGYDAITGAPNGASISDGTFPFAIARDGATLFTGALGAKKAAVARWALDGRGPINRVLAPGHVPVAYSPDGRTILTRAASASPIISETDAWSTTSRRHLVHLSEAAFPQLLDAHTAGGYFLDRLSVDRLDLRTGRYVGPRFPVTVAGVAQEGNDKNGRIFVAREGGSISRYEPDGTQIGDPWLKLASTPYHVSVSRDLVAFAFEDGSTRVYNIATATPAYEPIRDLSDPTFSGDGEILGGFTAASQLVLHDARTGRVRGTSFSTSRSSIWADFGGGNVAVETAKSGRIYDLATGTPIGEPFPSTDLPVLRPDGLELATSIPEGVALWDLNPDHWERAACKLAGRNLTQREWANYFPNAGSYERTCTEWPTGR